MSTFKALINDLGDIVLRVSATLGLTLILNRYHYLSLCSKSMYILVLVESLDFVKHQIELESQVLVEQRIAVFMIDQSGFCLVRVSLRPKGTSFPEDACLEFYVFVYLQAVEEGIHFDFGGLLCLTHPYILFDLVLYQCR